MNISAFFVRFLRCEVEGKKVMMRRKSCQQTNVKKMESGSLLKFTSDVQ